MGAEQLTTEPDSFVGALVRPRLETVWMAVAVAVPTAATWLGRTQAVDLAYQIRAGQAMLDSHHLLSTDVFTFTAAGHPWLNQQWLAEIVFATVWRGLGWGGIAVAWGILVGAVCLFVYLACRAVGARPVAAAVLTLAGYLIAVPLLTMRPQLIGVLLFAAVQWIVATRSVDARRLWLVPLLVVVWANLHGSFVLAFVLLGLAWIEDRRPAPATARRLALVGLVGLGGTLVNPYGVRVWSYVVSLTTDPTVSGRVAEWGPPSIRSATGALFFVSVLAVFVFLGTRSERPRPTAFVGACVFALIGMVALRGVVWWAMAAPVLIAPATGRIPEARSSRSWVNLAFLAALALLLAVSIPIDRGVDPSSGGPSVLTYAPEDLVRAARGVLPSGGHVFASEVYGSWVEFSAPDLPVFVDPRIELFPQDVWDDYFSVESGREGWAQTLDRWNVRVVVLHPYWAAGLLSVIDRDPAWHLVLRNDDGAVYARS